MFKDQKEKSKWHQFQHMCIVTIKALDESVFAFLRLRRNSRKALFVQAVGGNVVCRDCADLKSDPWTWFCFCQLFQIELFYYLHALSIILCESKNKHWLPCEIWLQRKCLLWPSLIYSFSLGVCECVSTRGATTASPAGSQPQVLQEIKQEISASWNKHPDKTPLFFLVTSLPPAAASKHLIFWCVFFSLKFS